MPAVFAANIAGKVLGKLSSAGFDEICLIWGVQNEFRKLKEVLIAIKAVVVDAEEQQMRNQEISLWLQKFKDACYKLEDLLDEFDIEALRKQVLQRESTRRKVRYFFSSSNPLAFRSRMGQRIKKAKEMLDAIAINKSKFHLLEKHEAVKNVVCSERETYSFVRASDIVGRDEDKANMLNFLMNPTHGEDVPVLPVVGIGGIGKTALAQLIFNDDSVQRHFELRIWVCVAEDFDIKQLMIKIIKSATGVECKDKNKEELCKILRDCLNGKRFFVLLDDVMNDDSKKWHELRDLLSGGVRGSKIIVTTRIRKVATITGTIPRYDLKLLSYENCLFLFLKLAFKEGEERQHQNLVRIGEKIVEKCKGVALAVKTLGSLLCSTRIERDWEVVKDSEIWKLEQKENDIMPALKLSYDHLPWHLKQCFAFCSIFPKDYEFKSSELIAMWMANGFLQTSNKNEEPEDIGKRYMDELWSRSFFQQFEDRVLYFRFKMHDLVHDLALSVAHNEVNSFNHYSSWNGRHLWLDLSRRGIPKLPNNMSHLQSLIFSNAKQKAGPGTILLIVTSISRSKHLKVLDLAECNIETLPDNIPYLKHLRYLSIAYNDSIKKLPNSICYLQSLETLDFSGCMGIEELPKDIRYLISLRILIVTTKQRKLQKNGIGCLSSLRMLVFYRCENLKYLFEDMQSLTALRTLAIGECKNLVSLPQGLKHLNALETLIIVNCEKLNLAMEIELGGNEDGSLRKLFIRGLPKVESLPQWIVLGSTKTLHHLYISNLDNLSTLPVWFQHLASLQKLSIEGCPKLSSLPEGMRYLTALKELEIKGCPKLGKRCIEVTGEDWPKIAHIPQIYLSNDMDTSTTDDELIR